MTLLLKMLKGLRCKRCQEPVSLCMCPGGPR